MGGILAVVAHPDDETLGCGGTLALHASTGSEVGVLCLTCAPPGRHTEIENACAELGVTDLEVLKASEIPRSKELVKKISDMIVSAKPEVVITHLPYDYHANHREAHEVVSEAVEWAAHTTTYEEPWRVRRLLLMEISTLIPTPHIIVDISGAISRKKAAVAMYTSQLAKFPWGYYERLTDRKAELRGIQGGCSYAEAFIEETLARNSPFYQSKSVKSLLGDKP